MHKLFRLLIFSGCVLTGTVSAQEVMTWVSPYFIRDSKTVLENTYGGIPVKSALSRVGLQFWNISSQGSVSLLHSTDADVRWFAGWGKENGIKILLTVINDGYPEHGYPGFDWTLVRAACYGTRGDTLIANLLAEADKYELDGIDLDFEGEDGQGGPFTGEDNVQYAAFVNKLCDSLHARGKLCTIDSYPGNDWGAPRPGWWSSWKDRINAIHTMGYTSSYWSCPTYMSYQGQQDLAIRAGIDPQKLLLGMPMWVDKWSGSNTNIGTSNAENLNHILNCLQHQAGIALWDIHTPVDVIGGTSTHPWTADTVWQLIKAIHDRQAPDPGRCGSKPSSGKIIDEMSNVGMNLAGGTWSAFSDNWSRTQADQPNATKVLIPDRSFDLALQYGTWGDIAPGYTDDPVSGMELQSIIKTFSKVGGDAAEGGFVMNLLPVDRSQDTTAEAWEIAKVGVEKDLSAFDRLVVGARCTSGKKIRIFLRTRAQLSVWAAGYGGYFDCTGEYEDYELPFASLRPVWGSGPTGFEAAHALQLTIEYVDAEPPNELALNIAGVAADTSVLSIKHRTAALVEESRTGSPFCRIGPGGICFDSEGETSLRLYSIEGRLLRSLSFYGDHLDWGYSLPAGIYIIRVQRAGRAWAGKLIIAQ
jgi:hypothetical protein